MITHLKFFIFFALHIYRAMKDIIYDFMRALINLAIVRKVCRHARSIVPYRRKYLGDKVLVKVFVC